MRIEAYTQVQQLYQSQKLSRTQKTKTATHTDRLQISSQGKDFQTAKAAVAAAPDIRFSIKLAKELPHFFLFLKQLLRKACIIHSISTVLDPCFNGSR